MFASVLAIILTGMSDYYRGEPKSESKPSHQHPGFNSYRDMFIAAIDAHGLVYADIQGVIHTNQTHEAEKRLDGEPELLERFLIRDISTLGYPAKGSFQVNYYRNGSVVIHSTSGIVKDLTSELGKEYHHPGFKVTFNMYKRIKDELTKEDYQVMATKTAGYWAASGTTTSKAEYIGYEAEAERDRVNLYIDIIPEASQNIEVNDHL
ncbi:hypothetical protein N7451_004141 [Penicillium sp. IBT 35674x]|nr:hypothetical protein N7451_004141 [Penicillium sp. IBT 35674x]